MLCLPVAGGPSTTPRGHNHTVSVRPQVIAPGGGPADKIYAYSTGARPARSKFHTATSVVIMTVVVVVVVVVVRVLEQFP